MAAGKMDMSTTELTDYLWSQYNPSDIWFTYSGLAVTAMIFLWLYDKFVLKSRK
jgi:hypothetical protein